ncbi:MAG: 4-(cytidine 5'-diphospho)-2-C-methyl-D-erythritol kinase [Eubacteriales bacterium]
MKSYAKINLTLDIIGKRENAYHDLETIFQTVSLHDDVSLRFTDSGGVTVISNLEHLPTGEKNLAVKATLAFWEYQGQLPKNVEITLYKRIPIFAGLGGGSSNAAAVLTLLNDEEKDPLSIDSLMDIAETIGADVPFFLMGGTAFGEGIGEILTPLPSLSPCHILIVKPNFACSTKEIFEKIDHGKIGTKPKTEEAIHALEEGKDISPYLCNVLMEGLGAEGEKIKEIIKYMKVLGAQNASMTGSGSAVFGIFQEEGLAHDAHIVLKEIYPEVYQTTPVGN